MVETPAAAISGSEIVPALRAKVAGYDDDVHPVYGFASFGTNDLTHPAPHTIVKMVRCFVADARAIDPKFEIFICSEHGGDVYTINRLHEIGLTGVSMSPRLGLSFDHQGASAPGPASA